MRPTPVWIIISIIITSLSLSGCGSSGSSDSTSSGTGVQGVSGIAGASSALLLSRDYGYSAKAPIGADGSFSAHVPSMPIAILILNAQDQPMGYLKFSNGMASIPAEELKTPTLNLGTLSLNGNTVLSSRDPFSDGDFDFNSTELRVLELSSSAFSSLAVQPDVDGNGKIDVLENKLYVPYVNYTVKGTIASGTLTGAVTPSTIDRYDLCFLAYDSLKPTSGVAFSGPSGSGLSNTPAIISTVSSAGNYCVQNLSALPGGTYTVSYTGQNLTFVLPDQSSAPQDVMVPLPTVTLNANGTVNKITWAYHMGDGTSGSTITPPKVISGVEVLVVGTNAGTYNSNSLPAGTTSHVLANQTIYWSDVVDIVIYLEDWYCGNMSAVYTVSH
ncbi:MAG: hypothetical protein ABSG90_14520 [Dehalococcoidia bacterium]|jgi:hypothetical protein